MSLQIAPANSMPNRVPFFVAGLMLVVVIALWLPFGFILPLHEPWLLHAIYESGSIPGVSLTGVRSLHYVIPWLAYRLSPDTFIGYHGLMIFGFWAKGFLLYLILRKLIPQEPVIPIAAGVLLIIFPADTAIFIMQATLHHIALASLLLSFYLFLLFRDRPNPFLFLAMMVCQWASISIYEAGLPVMFAAPLVVLLDRKLNRRAILLILGWLIVPTFWVVLLINFFQRPLSEQGYIGSVSSGALDGDNLLDSILNSVLKLYPNHFLAPWNNTLDSLDSVSLRFLALASFAAIIVGISVFLVSKMHSGRVPKTKPQWRYFLGFTIAGLILLLLGFVMYLPTELRNSTIRTYFYTAVGASISLVTLTYLFTRLFKGKYQSAAFAVLIAALTFTAVISDLKQHSALAQSANRLRLFLINVISTAPNLEKGTYLYLIGDQTVADYESPIADIYTGGLFSYLYQDYTMTTAYFQNRACVYLINTDNNQDDCLPGPEGIVITNTTGTLVIPYSQVVAVEFDENGNTTLLEEFPPDLVDSSHTTEYQPEHLIHRDQPYPLHARTVLGM